MIWGAENVAASSEWKAGPTFMYMGIHACHMRAGGPWKPEEGIRPPGSRVTGGCELPDVGAGNLT